MPRPPEPSAAAGGIDAALESRTVFASWARARGTGKRRDPDAARPVLRALMRRAGREEPVPSVVVTGSKGKGEIAARTAATLSASGLRTGLVSSPGILSNLDRFALDGRVVPLEDYHRWLRILEEVLAETRLPEGFYLAPTGLFTVLGHALLAEAGAQIVVHEAGLGGARDEVSLFDPLGLGFGAVFAEHLDVIGPTLRDVAQEKFGLIRSAAPVVSVPQSREVAGILRTRAREHGARIRWAADARAGFAAANRRAGWLLAGEAAAAARARGVVPTGTEPTGTELTETLPGQDLPEREPEIHRPGRGSLHRAPGGGRIIVDASISPEGLRHSLESVRRVTGRGPAAVYCSAPATKDLAGLLGLLAREGLPTVFVRLDSGHLDYRIPEELLGGVEVIGLAEILHRLRAGELPDPLLATGTISFGTALLRALGARVERLY